MCQHLFVFSSQQTKRHFPDAIAVPDLSAENHLPNECFISSPSMC